MFGMALLSFLRESKYLNKEYLAQAQTGIASTETQSTQIIGAWTLVSIPDDVCVCV